MRWLYRMKGGIPKEDDLLGCLGLDCNIAEVE